MAAQQTSIVIRGCRLIDGNGGKPVENATVLIEGHRIKQITTDTIDVAGAAKIIDANGKTVLPGFIDNHIHYRGFMGELLLGHGVTSVRDLGNPLEWILALRDAINLGEITGPRIFAAGGGFYGHATAAHHMGVQTVDEAHTMARNLVKLGVDYLKIHLGVSLDIIKAVAEVGREVGLKLSGHLESDIVPYVEAGIDGVEHGSGSAEATIRDEKRIKTLRSWKLWLPKFLGPWILAEPKYYPELVDFLAKKGTFIEPTAVLWGASLGLRNEWEKEDYEILKDPGLAYISDQERIQWLDHYYLAYGPRVDYEVTDEVIFGDGYSYYGNFPQSEMKAGFARMGEFIQQLVKAGGHVITGTDAPAVFPGISLHRDMELLVMAGLTPMQAIQAATKVGAEYLGKENELGTVEAGKIADVVIVNGDPLKDIRHTRLIDTVIKDGRIIDTSYHAWFTDLMPRPVGQEFYGYPTPIVERISPIVGSETDAEFVLTLKGKGFYPTSVVNFGSIPVPTRYVSPMELAARVPAQLLRPGTVSVSVVNPKPYQIRHRGGTSNPVSFIVKFRSRSVAR
jgi:imidazolonepropionase-like amidohydrolase